MWLGMRNYQIQESTKEILKNIELLQRHLKAYGDFHGKLGGHLETVINTYNNSTKEFKKIDKDVLKLTGVGMDAEIKSIQGPAEED